MIIRGIGSSSDQDINRMLPEGACFVIYQCCISILLMAFKWRPSSPERRILWEYVYPLESSRTDLMDRKDIATEAVMVANGVVQ